MTTMLLYAGAGMALISMLVVVFLVVAPPGPRVPLERRRAPGAVQVSALTRITNATVSAIDGTMKRRSSGMFSAAELELASIKLAPSGFVLLVSCAAVVLGALGLLASGPSLWAILLIPLFGALAFLGAKILVVIRKGSRRAKFSEQLDDCLTLLAGGLRAGHSLLRAVDAASQETEYPMNEELARVINETRIGRDLADSLETVAVRMRNEDFRWVAQAIAINREVGGNLSNVLDQVGYTIRERSAIRRQVKALSAEGRLSAMVLIALPIGVVAVLLIIQPSYFAGFLSNIIGILAIAVAVILLVVGSLWMLATVRVKF